MALKYNKRGELEGTKSLLKGLTSKPVSIIPITTKQQGNTRQMEIRWFGIHLSTVTVKEGENELDAIRFQ